MPTLEQLARQAMAFRMASAFVGKEQTVEAPPPPSETVLATGAFWTIYSGTLWRPRPRIVYNLDLFTEGTPNIPKRNDVLVEWLGTYDGSPGTGYHVTVGAGAATQLSAYWQSRPLAYAGRLCGPWSRMRLGWTTGQPIYPRATFGGTGVGSDNFIGWGTPGVWEQQIGPFLIEPADLDGDRPRIQNLELKATFGPGFDGVFFRRIEFTNGDALGSEPQPIILVPDGQLNAGMLGFADCYFKPRPFNYAGSGDSRYGAKWGGRTRSLKLLVVDSCKFGDHAESRFVQEHWWYDSNARGGVFMLNNDCATSSRTTFQFVNRQIDAPLSWENQGKGIGYVVVYNNSTDGSAWDTGYGGGGGSAFTFAPFGGPVYLDENTLRAKPTYSAGFEQRGGGIVVWWGGVKGSSDPLLTASGQTWPSEHACRSWLDDDGFGTPYVWIGPNNINTTNPIDQRAPLQLSNVREIHMYVGAGQTLTTGTSLSNPTIRLDHTQAGTGDAWAVPVLQYHDVVITPQYEAAKIRFYATYEEGVTAPAAGAGSDWNISATPWTCQKPSGDGSTGFSNFITTHPWVFDKP